MEVTNARIWLAYPSKEQDRLLAYSSITLDGEFVIHNLRIIRGNTGLLVAMPAHKLQAKCYCCNMSNNIQAYYCNHCGEELEPRDEDRFGTQDTAHPVTREFRCKINAAVLVAYYNELRKADECNDLYVRKVQKKL